jgi:hypothetical protein
MGGLVGNFFRPRRGDYARFSVRDTGMGIDALSQAEFDEAETIERIQTVCPGRRLWSVGPPTSSALSIRRRAKQQIVGFSGDTASATGP